jgi:hypothetical protein
MQAAPEKEPSPDLIQPVMVEEQNANRDGREATQNEVTSLRNVA